MSRLESKLVDLPCIGRTPYLAEILEDVEASDLRGAADAIRNRHAELPILLATSSKDKVAVLIAFPKSWVKEKGANAGKTLKPLGEFIQGGGGGSPEMAQAGGRRPEGICRDL